MMTAEIRKGDIENALDVMSALDDAMKERATRRAVTNLLRRTQRAAKARAPKDTGLLRKSIKVRVIKGRREKGLIYGRLGLDSGLVETDANGKRRRPAKYGVPVHQGHITAGGTHVPGVPFMRQAVNTLGSDIGADELSRSLIDATENIIKTRSKRR